jgi:hypothetical protein
LHLAKTAVEFATFDKLVMCSLLLDHSMVENDDSVSVADCANPVSNDENGAVLHLYFKGVLNELLGVGINATSGLVEYEYLRIGDQGAGEADSWR